MMRTPRPPFQFASSADAADRLPPVNPHDRMRFDKSLGESAGGSTDSDEIGRSAVDCGPAIPFFLSVIRPDADVLRESVTSETKDYAMIATNPAAQSTQQITLNRDSQSSCDCVCPCCKQRRCSAPSNHRSLPTSDKQHWHRCDCGVCPVW